MNAIRTDKLPRERLEELLIVLTNRWVELTKIDDELAAGCYPTDDMRLDLRLARRSLLEVIRSLKKRTKGR